MNSYTGNYSVAQYEVETSQCYANGSLMNFPIKPGETSKLARVCLRDTEMGTLQQKVNNDIEQIHA